MISTEGTVYEGDFKDRLPHGYGVENKNDGSYYKGEWYEGKY